MRNQVQSIQIGKAQVDEESIVSTFQGYGLASFCRTCRIYLVSSFRQRPLEELLNGNVVFYHQQSHRRFPPVQDFTPPDGMQETERWKLPKPENPAFTADPGHVYAHWDVVLDWRCQKRGRIDLESGERGRNGPSGMRLAALFFHFERYLFMVGTLPGPLNLAVGVYDSRFVRREGV